MVRILVRQGGARLCPARAASLRRAVHLRMVVPAVMSCLTGVGHRLRAVSLGGVVPAVMLCLTGVGHRLRVVSLGVAQVVRSSQPALAARTSIVHR